MNKLIYSIFVIFVVLMSCDGRDRVHKTNEEVLTENKLLDSFSENITYLPENYIEKATDSILNNGYRVRVKFYSDMLKSVLVEEQKDVIITKTYHRELVTDVEIYKNSTQIFKDTLNTNFLLNKGLFTITDSKSFMIQDFWLETYNDVHDGAPILFLDYVNAKSKEKRLFKFIFLESSCLIEEIT